MTNVEFLENIRDGFWNSQTTEGAPITTQDRIAAAQALRMIKIQEDHFLSLRILERKKAGLE